MATRVTLHGDPLITKVSIPDAVWRDIGNGLALRIAKRTRSGVDEDGGAFAAYSPGYARHKAKHQASGTVDLTSTNAGRHMVDDIVSLVKGDPRLTLTLATASKITLGLVHQEGMGHMPERRWFGLTEADLEYALGLIRRWWQRTVGTGTAGA